jgi:transcription-repair coupling factor (superfamily II helicase)
MDLLDLWDQAEDFRGLVAGLSRGLKEQLVLGLSGSQKTFLAAALWQRSGRSALYVVSGTAQAERVAEDLATWLAAG